MFYVQKNLLLFSVVSDESVQCVAVRDPANETRVGGEWYDGITLDSRTQSNKKL